MVSGSIDERPRDAGPRQSQWDKVVRRIVVAHTGWETPCWLWQGPTSGKGRGGFYGRMALLGQTVAVHLVMFCVAYGFLPGKKQVDHKCRQRLCCRPSHLEMVTPKVNAKRRDKARRPQDGRADIPAGDGEDRRNAGE